MPEYRTKTRIGFHLGGLVLFFCLLSSLAFADNSPPQVVFISPENSSSNPNQEVIFTTVYSDPDGYKNIQYVQLIFDTSASGKNDFFGYYNQRNNRLYLRNDTGTSWLGNYIVGSPNIIENSYCRLNCSKTTVSGSGNNLTVNWAITFKPTFTGSKNLFLLAMDNSNASSNWAKKGSWTINGINSPPQVVSVSPSSGSSISDEETTFTTVYSDPDGYKNIQYVQLIFDVSASGKNDFFGYYNQRNNRLYLRNDTGTSWLGNYLIGSQNIIENSYCKLNCSKTTVLRTGNNLTVNWVITFKPTFIGTKNIYLLAMDNSSASSNWTKKGSWTIQIDTTPPEIIITSPQDGAIVVDPQVQLQGTVDGILFSELRTLVEGENALSKTATDQAGNTSSASITIYLNTGQSQSIGPEGGEVTSKDGSVKVIIPPGALNQTKYITILAINKESLEDAVPGGSSLLSVVECKPYGLVFNKPVQIIYTLSQAEIPGTPVELGFYDAVQDKIIPTGQASTVPADGYTITFTLMHFSTYAALKSLIPQSIPIGSGVKIPVPDMFTGAFSHSIPISIPPGRKGLQPNLALTYRSSNPNSWVGLGYSLNPGYIVRSTRLGPPTYVDTKDTFYLITDQGTTELVWLVDNLYQAKIESGFTKFFKESDDSWKILSKDGSILRFGQTQDSKEISHQGTFSWYLTKAVDTNGNYIQFSYTNDQGKSYLTRIDYTGNEIGVWPTNSIEFFLEPREDISSSYISTSKIATARRLKEIEIKVNSSLVWRFELNYTYSPDTNRSLLTSITQYASDNKSLPTQRFSYQKAKQ